MAIKQTITCDLTDKELDKLGQERITIINVVYKKVEELTHPTKGNTYKAITGLEQYELHICADKAPEFMEELKSILLKLKENKQ